MWEDMYGHPISGGDLSDAVEWTMIRIWNPCGPPVVPGYDYIGLGTGGAGSVLPTIARAQATLCPSNSHPVLEGETTIPGMGEIRLEIR